MRRRSCERISPGGRLIGLDTDVGEMVSTAARLSSAGFGPDVVADPP